MSAAGRERTFGWSMIFALLALALGVAFAYPRQLTRGFMINDEAWYAEPARALMEGRGFLTNTLYPMQARHVSSMPIEEPFKQIGYPLTVALVGKATGTLNDRLFVIVALVGFALTGMATWLVAHAIVKNRWTAAAITLATIGNPGFWSYWTAALPESLFAALFLFGFYFLLGGSIAAYAAAGALLTTSVFFKGFSMMYLPFCAAFIFVVARERRWRSVASFAAGALVVIALGAALYPSGTKQLSEASGDYAGSMLLFETKGAYPTIGGPFNDINPIKPFPYIATHPLDYAEKVARMISRTKAIVGELGSHAWGGVLFPLLLFVALAVTQDLVSWLQGAGAKTSEDHPAEATESRPLRLLMAALIAVNFAFFWAGNFKARYFAHLFPLMLAGAVLEFRRLVPGARQWWAKMPLPITIVAVGYFLVYPPLVGIWTAYRDDDAYLGRMLPIHWVNYQQVASNVNAHVPEHAMVLSDMAYEISWYTGRPTMMFPGKEDQVDFLVDKFDIRAVYEHPRVLHDWPVLERRFKMIDDHNGRLWIRRD